MQDRPKRVLSAAHKEKISKHFKGRPRTNYVMSPEAAIARKEKLSKIAKERKLGGYNLRSGRGHKGWYKGYWCDSSYELAWIIYQLDHSIPFSRNLAKFQYEFDEKICNWIPDFILSDGSYVEIKGYETERSRAKIRDFPHPIVLLKEKDLTQIFQYVKDKYGTDYVRLYTEDTEVGSSSGLENRSNLEIG